VQRLLRHGFWGNLPRFLRLALITFRRNWGAPSIDQYRNTDTSHEKRKREEPTMPTTLNQTLHELAAELEKQNDDWGRVRLALEQVDSAARVAVDPRVLEELEDLCRKRTPVAPQRGGMRV
jgi:hypothetical protein